MGEYTVQPAKDLLTQRYFAIDGEEYLAEADTPELDSIHAENRAIAAYIVHACNLHGELVGALSELVAEWETTCAEYTSEHPMSFLRDTGGIEWARAVLARCGED